MGTVSGRLARALEHHAPEGIKGDRKAFQRALRAHVEAVGAEVEGTSYPSVSSYFAGSVVPALTWLEHAAEILGVRPEWLAVGQGEATKELEFNRQIGETTAAARKKQKEREAELAEAMRVFPAPVSHTALAVFVRSMSLFNADPLVGLRARSPMPPDAFARALAAPFETLGKDYGTPDNDALEAYLIEAAPVLARAIRDAWGHHLTKTNIQRSEKGGDHGAA